MRILLTGANGQLGHELLETLATEEVHGTDEHDLDIRNRDAVFQAVEGLRPAWIINAAAFNDVDGAETAAERAFAINGAGPGNLADAAARAGSRLVHLSTDYVFDGTKGTPYTEDDHPNPQSVYARSKYEGELRVLNSGAQACVLRTAWLYGRHGKNFVNAILAAAGRGGPLRVVTDQVGSPTSAADLARAIGQVLRTSAEGLFHTVNAGQCSRFEFAQAIVRGAVEVLPITTPEARRTAPRPANSALVSVRWQAAGFEALRHWQAALSEFLAG